MDKRSGPMLCRYDMTKQYQGRCTTCGEKGVWCIMLNEWMFVSACDKHKASIIYQLRIRINGQKT